MKEKRQNQNQPLSDVLKEVRELVDNPLNTKEVRFEVYEAAIDWGMVSQYAEKPQDVHYFGSRLTSVKNPQGAVLLQFATEGILLPKIEQVSHNKIPPKFIGWRTDTYERDETDINIWVSESAGGILQQLEGLTEDELEHFKSHCENMDNKIVELSKQKPSNDEIVSAYYPNGTVLIIGVGSIPEPEEPNDGPSF